MDDALHRLSRKLIEIDSVNPGLTAGAAGEAEIALFVRNWLSKAGIEADCLEAAPGRPSVIGRIKGKGGGRSLLLSAHLDTVGVGDMEAPFTPRVEGGRLFGRGSYDMKSGLAACMMALFDVRNADLKGDVLLAAVADEEFASIGIQSVLKELKADAAILAEPTDLDLVIAHKGFSWHEIVTEGRVAHGSRPDLGVDAILHMGRVLGGIEALQQRLAAGSAHPLLSRGSLHASLISGGKELSSYPGSCSLQLERRTLPGETGDKVAAELDEVLRRLAAADGTFQAKAKTLLVRPPYSIRSDAPIVELIGAQAAQVLGCAPRIAGAPWWMDSAFISEAGIPTVVMGPTGGGAHTKEEWVDLESVCQCRAIYSSTIRAFCQ